MPYAYYRRLSAHQKAVYRQSDKITRVKIPHADPIRPLLETIREGLESDDHRSVQKGATAFTRALNKALEAPPVTMRVLARRPSNATSELHGLYEREEGKRPVIRVWMRTAAYERPVAFRTFVRTMLHELCHHYDFDLLELADSFHTEGFFRREASLARQLLPPAPRRKQAQLPLPGIV